ncbi:MAG TPA: GNAT family N-acetyltransferase [Pseudolabrys sp.]|nr:GNAT family N-acetyltransferase [Pseudolabrys sp.]
MPYGFVGDLPLLIELAYDTLWGASAAMAERTAPRREAGHSIDIAEGEDAVALAAPDWQALEARNGAGTAFQTLALAEHAAAAHRRRGDLVRIVVVRENGRPAVIFPTAISRFGGLRIIRFLGDPLIQYGDVVAAPGTSTKAIAAAYRAAADPRHATLMLLRKVRADARLASLLAQQSTPIATQAAPFIDLRAAPKSHPRDERELRRFRRRLAERGECRFTLLAGEDARRATVEALTLKRAWLAERGLPSSVIGNADWDDAIVAMAGDAGLVRVARLSVGGSTAALEVALLHGGRWHAFIGARAAKFEKAGPGHVQMAETIAACRDRGISVYDLLAPSDPYKRAIAHDAVVLNDYAMALTRVGGIGLALAPLLPSLKRTLTRLPCGVRRILLRAGSSA